MKSKEQLVIETVEWVANRLLGGITCSYLAMRTINEIGGIEEAKRRWLNVNAADIENLARKVVDENFPTIEK